MTTQQDLAARLVRLRNGGALNTRLTAANAETHTCDPRAVAVVFANTAGVRVRYRMDGTPATSASGFPLGPGAVSPFYEIDGEVEISFIQEGGAAKDVEVLEILDTPPE